MRASPPAVSVSGCCRHQRSLLNDGVSMAGRGRTLLRRPRLTPDQPPLHPFPRAPRHRESTYSARSARTGYFFIILRAPKGMRTKMKSTPLACRQISPPDSRPMISGRGASAGGLPVILNLSENPSGNPCGVWPAGISSA